MNVFRRQIIKGSAANFMGIGLGVVNNIWIFPLAFSLEELGIYRWVERTAVLIAAIALLGLHRTYVRYQSRFTNERSGLFLSNILFLALVSTFLCALVFTFFAGTLAEILGASGSADELQFLGAVVAGSMTYTLGLSIASSAKRISIPFFLKNVGIRGALLIGAYLVSRSMASFSQWMQLLALVHLAVGSVVLIYAVWLKGVTLVRPRPLGEGLNKELATFASSGIVMAMMTMGLATIDSQMVAGMLSYEALGVYSIAFFIGSFVDGIRRPVSQALSPQFANLWYEGAMDQLAQTYARTSRVLMSVALLALVAIVPNLDDLFSWIPDPDRFEAAKPVVVLILLSRVIDYSFGSNGEILSNGPHFKWNLFAISGLVVGLIGLNYLLLPLYGLRGAGYALVAAYTIFNLVKARFLYLKEGIQPFGTVQLQLLFFAAAVLGGAILIESLLSESYWLRLVVKNAFIALGAGLGFIVLRRKI